MLPFILGKMLDQVEGNHAVQCLVRGMRQCFHHIALLNAVYSQPPGRGHLFGRAVNPGDVSVAHPAGHVYQCAVTTAEFQDMRAFIRRKMLTDKFFQHGQPWLQSGQTIWCQFPLSACDIGIVDAGAIFIPAHFWCYPFQKSEVVSDPLKG